MGVVQVGHRFAIQVGEASFCFLSQEDKWAFSACFSFSLLLLFFLGMSFSFYFFCFFGVSLDNLRVISVPEMGEMFSFTFHTCPVEPLKLPLEMSTGQRHIRCRGLHIP